MKTTSIILSIIALGLIIFNFTKINFSNPLQGESTVAIIGIAAGLIAILILIIFNLSKKIERKMKQ